MTNNSNQHVKVIKNQTLGMLKSCDSDQICTIHRLVTFELKSLGGEGIKLDHTKSSQTINSIKTQPTTIPMMFKVSQKILIKSQQETKRENLRCKHYSKMKCPK